MADMGKDYDGMIREPLPKYATDAGVKWAIACGTGGDRDTADNVLQAFVKDAEDMRKSLEG